MHVTGQAVDDPSLYNENEGVAETLIHESDLAIVGRNVRPLAEVGEDFNIRWQIFERIARLALGQCSR